MGVKKFVLSAVKETTINILENVRDDLKVYLAIQPYQVTSKLVDKLLDALDELKEKVSKSPNEIDNICFDTAVSMLEAIADKIKERVEILKK